MAIKILLISANPRDEDYLQAKKEHEGIREIFKENKEIECIVENDTKPTELADLLVKTNPHVVHFTGHGTGNSLVFVDEQGKRKLIEHEKIVNIFRLLHETKNGNIRLVFFNSCNTIKLAEQIAEYTGCAIGVKHDILDKAAIFFSISFYKMLSMEFSIRKSFDWGKNYLSLSDYEDEGCCFELFTKEKDIEQKTITRTYGEYEVLCLQNVLKLLKFAKSIHHIFQSLEIEYIRSFITIIDEISKFKSLHKANELVSTWDTYCIRYNMFISELNNEFQEYQKTIMGVFNILLSCENPMNDFLKKSRSHYELINDHMDEYSSIHKKADKVVASAIGSSISNDDLCLFIHLERRAKSLLIESDNMIRTIIKALSKD